jgi:hypothetical protein
MMIETKPRVLIDLQNLTAGEKNEMTKLGILSEANEITDTKFPELHYERPPIEKFAVHAPHTINEAYNYEKPSSFSPRIANELWQHQSAADIGHGQRKRRRQTGAYR